MRNSDDCIYDYARSFFEEGFKSNALYTGILNSLMNIKDTYLLYYFEIILIPTVSSTMGTV